MKNSTYLLLTIAIVFLGTYLNLKKSEGNPEDQVYVSTREKAARLISKLISEPDNFIEYIVTKDMRDHVEIKAKTKDGLEIIYRNNTSGEWLQINTKDVKILDKSGVGKVFLASSIEDGNVPEYEIRRRFEEKKSWWQMEYENLITKALQSHPHSP